MGLKMKNFNIMGVHQFLCDGGKKTNIQRELPKKGGAWTICRVLGKKERECYGGGVDTQMQTKI